MPEDRIFDAEGCLVFFKKQAGTIDNEKTILFIACGDTGPVRKLEQIVLQKGSHHVLGNIKNIMQTAGVIFANLECTFSLRGKPLDRIPVFRLNPESFPIVKESKINIVSVANNHMSDYGPESFQDTLDLLDKNNIAHIGGGLTREDSLKPCIMEIQGIKLGFMGFREKETRISNRTDVYTAEIDESISRRIKMLRPMVDWVILSLHFGWEYQSYPSPQDVALCRGFIDAGADIILGHHPHYPQGIEKYKNGIIAYSLGNFLWDQNFIGHTSSSYILQLELSKNRIISARAIPSRMNKDYRLELHNSPESIHELNILSSTIREHKRLREQWYFSSRNKVIEFLRIVFGNMPQTLRKKNILKAINYARSPRFLYTIRSFLYFLCTGQAFMYELKKRIITRHAS